jgi:hypothetical protein
MDTGAYTLNCCSSQNSDVTLALKISFDVQVIKVHDEYHRILF